MGVFAVQEQGESNGGTVSPPVEHHKEPHTTSAKSVFLESKSSVNIRKGKRPLDDGPLCSGSGEVSGIIGPPPVKRPADPSPKAHVNDKPRKQFIVKIVSTTFIATYIRQWACVAKYGTTSFKVNPKSWQGVLSVVFQRIKPLHRQMIDAFERFERGGWLGQRDLFWHQSFRHVTETAEPKVADIAGGDRHEDVKPNNPDITGTNLNDACLNSGIQNSRTSSNNTVRSKFAEAAQVHDPTGIRVAPGWPTRVVLVLGATPTS